MGNVFGSRRCDCGDQLRLAPASPAPASGSPAGCRWKRRPINADNRHMIAKAERSGHRFDPLAALLANPS